MRRSGEIWGDLGRCPAQRLGHDSTDLPRGRARSTLRWRDGRPHTPRRGSSAHGRQDCAHDGRRIATRHRPDRRHTQVHYRRVLAPALAALRGSGALRRRLPAARFTARLFTAPGCERRRSGAASRAARARPAASRGAVSTGALAPPRPLPRGAWSSLVGGARASRLPLPARYDPPACGHCSLWSLFRPRRLMRDALRSTPVAASAPLACLKARDRARSRERRARGRRAGPSESVRDRAPPVWASGRETGRDPRREAVRDVRECDARRARSTPRTRSSGPTLCRSPLPPPTSCGRRTPSEWARRRSPLAARPRRTPSPRGGGPD